MNKPPRPLRQIEGELVERRSSIKIQQGRARTLNNLIDLGRRRGYRYPAAWAKHVMQGRART